MSTSCASPSQHSTNLSNKPDQKNLVSNYPQAVFESHPHLMKIDEVYIQSLSTGKVDCGVVPVLNTFLKLYSSYKQQSTFQLKILYPDGYRNKTFFS